MKRLKRVVLSLSFCAVSLFSSLAYALSCGISVSAAADFDTELAKWLEKDTVNDKERYMWSFIICSLRTDGYSENGIAGVLGNMRCESGNSAYSIEGYSGIKADDGSSLSDMQDGGTYVFSSKPAPFDGCYYNGHGLIQFSGPWAQDMLDWSASHDFTLCTVTHYCSPLTGYGSETCIKHTCKMANTVGQMTYLIECLKKDYPQIAADLSKENIDIGVATKEFHDNVEKSATSNITERANYGRSSVDVIKACTKVVGGDDIKMGDSTATEQTNIMVKELVLGKIWDEEQIVQFQGLNEGALTLPDSSMLNLNDRGEVSSWKKSIDYSKDERYFALPRQAFVFLGICITIWAILLYIAYWFDRINNFIEIQFLPILSLGILHVSPDDGVSTYERKQIGKKTVVHKDMIKVTIIGVAIGVLLLSERLNFLVNRLISWFINLF